MTQSLNHSSLNQVGHSIQSVMCYFEMDTFWASETDYTITKRVISK